MRSEERRGLRVGRLQRVVGVGAIHGRKSEARALEHLTRPLERRQRVVERRRRWVVGDGQDLALLLRHAGEERGQIVAVLDPREIGRLQRKGARLGERVRGRQRGGSGRFRLLRSRGGIGGRGDGNSRGRNEKLVDHVSPHAVINWREGLSNRLAAYASLNISRSSKGPPASLRRTARAWRRRRPGLCSTR